ncbi:(2Fe-2S)-binding protein [Gallibacterium salpingitidis]|uniref:(2Fe-2S)-binding protein n=1 Tax=Gallibacterium salpingitidis TaxID=505341 RepID=A0A1A7PX69_9PAST|nr:class I ribonucleotide reductase maintenance protein YfaE [Gallibacterium salpingitidis]OBW92588.1 (2Fe-2S)-binding protein [Gallibacterium salpingitidis]OBX06629.1 (2Fe-2S)-binding protein [Gallibacterium salpingitidis]WKS98984.1 class I ribonucleotide reductase maintenance protein YfaE [Gallibacterium salpingitidis]
MKIYRVQLKRSQKTLLHDNQCSLLENLEQNGIRHEYQCRSGYCGACRAKLLTGTVSYRQPPLAFLQADDVLLCCCQLESDLELDL